MNPIQNDSIPHVNGAVPCLKVQLSKSLCRKIAEIQLLKTGDIWQRKELYEVYLLIQKVGVAYYKVHKPISIKLNYPEAATLYAMLQSTGEWQMQTDIRIVIGALDKFLVNN